MDVSFRRSRPSGRPLMYRRHTWQLLAGITGISVRNRHRYYHTTVISTLFAGVSNDTHTPSPIPLLLCAVRFLRPPPRRFCLLASDDPLLPRDDCCQVCVIRAHNLHRFPSIPRILLFNSLGGGGGIIVIRYYFLSLAELTNSRFLLLHREKIYV